MYVPSSHGAATRGPVAVGPGVLLLPSGAAADGLAGQSVVGAGRSSGRRL